MRSITSEFLEVQPMVRGDKHKLLDDLCQDNLWCCECSDLRIYINSKVFTKTFIEKFLGFLKLTEGYGLFESMLFGASSFFHSLALSKNIWWCYRMVARKCRRRTPESCRSLACSYTLLRTLWRRQNEFSLYSLGFVAYLDCFIPWRIFLKLIIE